MEDNSTCVVITPFINKIEHTVEKQLRLLETRGYAVWREHGISAIDYARSLLATRAIEAGYTETLWIDSDVDFSPDQVDQLRTLTWQDLLNSENTQQSRKAIEQLSKEYEKPGILCGLYVKKSATDFAANFRPTTRKLIFGNHAEPMLIKNAGAGMMLVRSWLYKRVQDFHALPLCSSSNGIPVIPFFLPMVVVENSGDAIYLCEDYAFCERVRAAGIPIFADMRMRLFHIGNYGFSWEDLSCKMTRFDQFDLEREANPAVVGKKGETR